jgi:hypothetical protein
VVAELYSLYGRQVRWGYATAGLQKFLPYVLLIPPPLAMFKIQENAARCVVIDSSIVPDQWTLSTSRFCQSYGFAEEWNSGQGPQDFPRGIRESSDPPPQELVL